MVRRNGNVSIYSYVIRMLQVNLVPVHTTYIRPYIVLGTSWYQPGTSLQYSSYGWNFSLVITAHTATTLHETQNGFGREQRWMEVQITGLHRRRRLVTCKGKGQWTHIGEAIMISLNKPTLWTNVLGIFISHAPAQRRPLDNGETSSLAPLAPSGSSLLEVWE